MKYLFQAFREPAPKDLPANQEWDFDLNEAFILILALKFVFIVVFEVIFLKKVA